MELLDRIKEEQNALKVAREALEANEILRKRPTTNQQYYVLQRTRCVIEGQLKRAEAFLKKHQAVIELQEDIEFLNQMLQKNLQRQNELLDGGVSSSRNAEFVDLCAEENGIRLQLAALQAEPVRVQRPVQLI